MIPQIPQCKTRKKAKARQIPFFFALKLLLRPKCTKLQDSGNVI